MKSIIYSLKRNSFFFLFLVFPFVGFCNYDHFLTNGVGQVRIYRYTSASASAVSFTSCSCSDSSDLLVAYQNHPFGLRVSSDTDDIRSPSVDVVPNRTWGIDRQVQCYTNEVGSSAYFSPRDFSTLHRLYFLAASLFYSGYRGSGITVLGGSSFVYFNFDYRSAIADILCSTNTVYRSLVLSHLSQIQSSVVNIDTGVSALVPSVDRIADINSSIATNSFDAVSLLRNIDTNFSSAVSSILDVNPRLDSVTNLLELLHNDNVLSNLDVFLGDDTSSWIGFVNWACDNFLITSSDRDLFIQELNDTDSSNNNRSRSYSIPLAHRRFLVKNKIKGRVVAANKMRGQLQMLYPSFDLNSSGSSWGLQALGDIGYQFTTGVRHELMNNNATVVDWREGLRQQLQDWKTSDEHGILNVKNKIDDVDSAIKKNFEFTPPVGLGNPLGTNTIPYTSFVTNYVTAPLTNSIDDAAGRIVTNASAEAQSTRDYLAENLFDPTAGGAYVNIRFPIYGEHQKAVHVHDDALDVFGSGIDELNYNVTAVLGDMNSHWEKWFRLWGDWSPSVSSNIEEILDVLLHWTNTTAQLNHVLFEDYSNYVHSAYYDNLFSTLENDYPVCYSNLVKFGLSSSEDGGRWWNVLASSVSYDTAMMSYVFSDMVELDRIARDNLGESPFSFLQRTLNDMPSKSQIEDYVSQASNATFQVVESLASLSNSLAVVSNSFDNVFNPFRGHFDSPGSSVTFFKIHDGHDGQYVTIPVGDQADAWRYIRLGVSFGLVAVNLLLFPKYLLMLFTLFIKAYRIGIKFFPDDR